MYKVVKDFKDLMTGQDYKKGDTYPHTGKADAERVEILSRPTTQRGALIEFVEDEVKAEKTSAKKSK